MSTEKDRSVFFDYSRIKAKHIPFTDLFSILCISQANIDSID